jgi:hypothetical protein
MAHHARRPALAQHHGAQAADARARHETAELDFKLIDLEKFPAGRRRGARRRGTDRRSALAQSSLKGASDRRPLTELIEAIEGAYAAFAGERGDQTFPIRQQLAQARALIRVAKGRTKFGEASLRESRRAPAISVAFETLDLAQEAMVHLQTVLDALRQTT